MIILNRAGKLMSTAILAGIVTACATLAEDPVKDATLTLQPQQTLALSKTITLRYDRVVDTRCPKGVLCVWAGKVVYHFTLAGVGGTESFALEADKPRYLSKVVKGVTIVLATTEPPDVVAPGEPQPEHPVTVSITRQ
jgi:hypothetical protein